MHSLVWSLTALVALSTAVGFYLKRRFYDYWQRRGFPYDKKSSWPFGCLGAVLRNEQSMGDAIHDVYRRSQDERFVGMNLFYRPALLVRDVNLVRRILAQDFSSFHDRGVYVDEIGNPMSANLFSLEGKSWREMRLQLSPCFTSGKLKNMFAVSLDVGERMLEHMHRLVPAGEVTQIDLRDILTIYANDIIAAVIFGLDLNSFENPKNIFRSVVDVMEENSLIHRMINTCVFLCPAIMRIFKYLPYVNAMTVKLRSIMKDTIEYRERNNVERKDMLQLLMQLRNTGRISDDDDNWNARATTNSAVDGSPAFIGSRRAEPQPLSLDKIAAQGFIFYVAGQETTAMTAAATLFELAQYPELRRRAQEEVRSKLVANEGIITYELLQGMTFLDCCLMETLRKYPGLAFLNRVCTKNYLIPDSDMFIERGTAIVISVLGIHRDPANFPEPDRYDPDRYDPAQPRYNKNAYMPFGEGPRQCIALRMGKLNAKLAVVKILHAFDFETLERQEIAIAPHAVGMTPKVGIKVRLSRKQI